MFHAYALLISRALHPAALKVLPQYPRRQMKNQAKRRRAIMLFADSDHFRLPFIGFRASPFQPLQKAQKTPLKAHKSPFIPRTPRRGSPYTRVLRTSRKNNVAPSRFPCFSSTGAGVHARRSTYPAGKLCGCLPDPAPAPPFSTLHKKGKAGPSLSDRQSIRGISADREEDNARR